MLLEKYPCIVPQAPSAAVSPHAAAVAAPHLSLCPRLLLLFSYSFVVWFCLFCPKAAVDNREPHWSLSWQSSARGSLTCTHLADKSCHNDSIAINPDKTCKSLMWHLTRRNRACVCVCVCACVCVLSHCDMISGLAVYMFNPSESTRF